MQILANRTQVFRNTSDKHFRVGKGVITARFQLFRDISAHLEGGAGMDVTFNQGSAKSFDQLCSVCVI